MENAQQVLGCFDHGNPTQFGQNAFEKHRETVLLGGLNNSIAFLCSPLASSTKVPGREHKKIQQGLASKLTTLPFDERAELYAEWTYNQCLELCAAASKHANQNMKNTGLLDSEGNFEKRSIRIWSAWWAEFVSSYKMAAVDWYAEFLRGHDIGREAARDLWDSVIAKMVEDTLNLTIESRLNQLTKNPEKLVGSSALTGEQLNSLTEWMSNLNEALEPIAKKATVTCQGQVHALIWDFTETLTTSNE